MHRLDPSAQVPPHVSDRPPYWIGKTDEELSIVCASDIDMDSASQSTGWSCLKVEGPLDHGLTGILAGIAGVLAGAGVAIIALSTFDTDYMLVKTAQCGVAAEAVRSAGYRLD